MNGKQKEKANILSISNACNEFNRSLIFHHSIKRYPNSFSEQYFDFSFLLFITTDSSFDFLSPIFFVIYALFSYSFKHLLRN